MEEAYKSFGELSGYETEGQDYAVRICLRNGRVLVMAPHGGKIEPGTAEIAVLRPNVRVSVSLPYGQDSVPWHASRPPHLRMLFDGGTYA